MAELTKEEKKRKIKWQIGEVYWHARVKIKRILHIEPQIREMMHVLDMGEYIEYRDKRIGCKPLPPLMLSEIMYYTDKNLFVNGRHNSDYFVKVEKV